MKKPSRLLVITHNLETRETVIDMDSEGMVIHAHLSGKKISRMIKNYPWQQILPALAMVSVPSTSVGVDRKPAGKKKGRRTKRTSKLAPFPILP